MKAKIEAVRIEGAAPAGTNAWSCIHAFLTLGAPANGFAGRWSAAAKTADIPPFPADPDDARSHIMKLGQLVERKCFFHAGVLTKRKRPALTALPTS